VKFNYLGQKLLIFQRQDRKAIYPNFKPLPTFFNQL